MTDYMQDQIMAPDELLIKNNDFYLFYEMMIQSLNTDNVKEGLNKSLQMLRDHLKSGNINIYRKSEDGVYVFKRSDSQIDETLSKSIGCIVNKTKPILEQKGIFYLDLNLSERLKNMMLLHINITDNNNDNKGEIGVAILNIEDDKQFDMRFWRRTKDTIKIILKRAASYERNIKAITTDFLTGLDNRNSYEMRIQSFNEADENLVLGIFDLFRLKHINDSYTHSKGDEYIKGAAKILDKYWPKQKVRINDDGTEEVTNTGHCVYRVGGDEFALLTSKENIALTTIKAGLATQEVSMLDLGLGEDVPIGLNSGIVTHKPGDYYKKTFMKADELMQVDKEQMYKTLKIDRRR